VHVTHKSLSSRRWTQTAQSVLLVLAVALLVLLVALALVGLASEG
jgi:hypothetical protein